MNGTTILLDVGIDLVKCKQISELLETDEDNAELRAEQLYAKMIDSKATLLITESLEVYELLKNYDINILYLTSK